MHKQKSAKFIGSMIILTSLAVLAALMSASLTSVVTTSSLKPLVSVYGQEEQSVEEPYLKLVSTAVQLLPNDSSNSNTTTIQIPQTAKGPTISTAI
ncbi:MAG: hypothetical protein QN716_07695 [Nitrososphaeraceae archaeon]|nr:hypothetical protein [Nitrososphaeraceae archaeon]